MRQLRDACSFINSAKYTRGALRGLLGSSGALRGLVGSRGYGGVFQLNGKPPKSCTILAHTLKTLDGSKEPAFRALDNI